MYKNHHLRNGGKKKGLFLHCSERWVEGVGKGIIIIFKYLECCHGEVGLDMFCEAVWGTIRYQRLEKGRSSIRSRLINYIYICDIYMYVYIKYL